MTSQKSADQLQQPVELRATGMFQTQQAAETAQRELQNADFPAEHISLTTQKIDPNPSANETQAAESAKGGAIIGVVFGMMMGLLFAITGQDFPGLTPLHFDQPLGFYLLVALGGAVIGGGGGAVIGGLAGLSVPKPQANPDRTKLSHKYLLTVQGSEAEIARAEEILRQQGGQVRA